MSFSAEEILEELEYRKKTRRLSFLFTDEDRELYQKHLDFFRAGQNYRQRMFRAGNRVGKTTAMGVELCFHLTGRYPKWWEGHRFTGTNLWWVCGKSSETIRQILQPLLLGPIGEFGTGLIPADALDFETLTDAKKAGTHVSTIRIRHVNGAFSQVEFKAYEQGRQAFEGTERSIWLDEEPPLDVYTECLTRTMTGGNVLALTFTPLKGASEVVLSFARDSSFDDGEVGPGKWVTTATWDDVPHLDEQAKAELLAAYPPYQRDARSRGVPSLGSGVIYPVPEGDFLVEPFEIPASWPRLAGLDVGGKTASVWLAIDPDTRQTFAYSAYYKERQEPSIHAAAIRARGDWIPIATDPAARGRSQIDGQQLMQMYRDLGLKVQNAVNAVETGLYTVWEALSIGQLKIFNRGCEPLLKEMRTYARDERGNVIKANDHCCDALRYGYMTRDIAKTNLATRLNTDTSGLPGPNLAW
jgi:phage terminase large subunit-like protein